MKLLVQKSVRDQITGLDACTVEAIDPACFDAHQSVIVGTLRTKIGPMIDVAVTLCEDVQRIQALVQVLHTSRTESVAAKALIVCDGEPIPDSLLRRIPEHLHTLLRRPQTTDLVFLNAEGLKQARPEQNLLEVGLSLQAKSFSATGGSSDARFPAAGPGSPVVSSDVLATAIRESLATFGGSTQERRCVESGLLLLWDCLEESHQISQTMEGKGTPRTADYWHGIMHRREPDAGNASYWFRRVGSHPAFESLAAGLLKWMESLGASTEQRDFVSRSLLVDNVFTPFAMIKLCQTAIDSPHAPQAATYRMVQYLEILNLLAWSC